MRKLKMLILMLILLLGMTTTTVIGQDDHDDGHVAEDTCHDPTEEVVIGTEDSTNAFNVTEVTVSRGACVMLTFVNTQDTEHDLAVHNGDDELFGLHLNTSGHMMINYEMPDEDVTLDFWCTVTGHKDQGMEGVIIVGEGSAGFLPGFGFTVTLVAFTSMLILAVRRRG